MVTLKIMLQEDPWQCIEKPAFTFGVPFELMDHFNIIKYGRCKLLPTKPKTNENVKTQFHGPENL